MRCSMRCPVMKKPFEHLRAHEEISNAIVDLFGNATRFGNVLARNDELIKGNTRSRQPLPGSG